MSAFALGLASAFGLITTPPLFTELHSDRPDYSIGSRAVLTVELPIQPSNPAYGLALEARLGGVPIRMLRLTDRMAAVVTPVLNTAGPQNWEVTVSL